jgi:hypothetical protein
MADAGGCPWWGLEFDWLAVDRGGHVASLCTAGYGPVPVAVVFHVQTIEAYDSIHELARVGSCAEAAQVDLNGDWVGTAERGIFVYDWDHHDRYRRATVPSMPIVVAQLPNDLRQLALLVQLNTSFVIATEIDLEGVDVMSH